jgi:hypothetical protein
MKTTSNGIYLDRILEPVSSSLNKEASRKILGLKADRKVQTRVNKLADKCNEANSRARNAGNMKRTSWPTTS